MRRLRLPPIADLCDRAITRLEHSRRHQAAAVVVVSVSVGAVTAHLMTSARTARERWTGAVPVLVSTRAIAADAPVDGDAVRLVSLPPALVSDDAIAALPTGARLAVAVEARTQITAALLAKDAAVVPESWRTVALPDDVVTPPLAPGQEVDVVAGGATLAPGAVVATVDPLTVAVDPDVAADVAAAARMGEVSLVAGG